MSGFGFASARGNADGAPGPNVVGAFTNGDVECVLRLAGGQTGAEVWRVDFADAKPIILRATREPIDLDPVFWFVDRITLDTTHRRAAHLDPCESSPLLLGNSTAEAALRHSVYLDGRYWYAETYVDGFPNLPTTLEELPAVFRAVAHLHRQLREPERQMRQMTDVTSFGPSRTAVERVGICDRYGLGSHPKLAELRRRLAAVPHVPIQPVWRDLWSAHVLLHPTKPPGFIDPYAGTFDNVAVDLGRLLGSLPGLSAPQRAAALDAYDEVAETPVDRDLVTLFEETGIVLSVLRWRTRPDSPMKSQRMTQLLPRFESLR